MTVSSSVSRIDYIGSGSQGPYTFPFQVFAATDVQVTTRFLATGVETPLTYGSQFNVIGVGDRTGGAVYLVTALSSAYALTIRRVVPLLQSTDLRNQGAYFPEDIENALDYVVMIGQQQQDDLDRAVTLPVTVSPSVVSAELPVPVANEVLVWNASATALENRPLVSSANVALPGAGRTVSTLSAYLANNAVFNVRDYGAVGDGSHDDTSAILAADAAACNGSVGGVGNVVQAQGAVYFPAGTYKHTGLTFRGAPWFGDGPNATILDYYGSAVGVVAVGDNTHRKMVRIVGMTMLGSHASSGAKGLTLGHCYRSQGLLERVIITLFPAHGILFTAPMWNVTFYDVYVNGCGATNGVPGIANTGPGDASAGVTWFGLNLEGNGKNGSGVPGGIYVTGCGSWTFYGGVWESNPGSCEAEFHDMRVVSIDGLYYEGEPTPGGAIDGFVFSGNTVARMNAVPIQTGIAKPGCYGIIAKDTVSLSLSGIFSNQSFEKALKVQDSAHVYLMDEGYAMDDASVVIVGATALFQRYAFPLRIGAGTPLPESEFHAQRAAVAGEGGILTVDNRAVSTLGNKAGVVFLTDAGASVAGTRNAQVMAVNVNAGNGAAELALSTWDGSALLERLRLGVQNVIKGDTIVSGDLLVSRVDATSRTYLSITGTHYLGWDGTKFNFVGGVLNLDDGLKFNTSFGAFGHAGVGQQASAAVSTDLASVITLANALRTALLNLGLTA